MKVARVSAQVGQHQGVAGDAGDYVDAAGKTEVVVAVEGRRRLLQFFEGLDGADDRAVLVVNGDGADADRNFVSRFVVQKSDGLGGVRRLDGAGDRTIFFAEFASRLIAVQQSFRDTGVANDFVAQMAGDALGAVAPEDDFLLHVDDAQADGQAFQNAAADVGIVK